jgi:hypothetical protein
VNLLIDQRVYDEQYKGIIKIKSERNSELIRYNDMKFLIAEDPKVALNIQNALKRNEIVFFFLDGNTGSGKNQVKSIKVPFFEQQMYARTGAITLAQMNDSAVIPMYSNWRKSNHAEVIFDAPIKIKKIKAKAVTKSLYEYFTQMIEKEPWQWEQWVDCHRFWVKPQNLEVTQLKEDEVTESISFIENTPNEAEISINNNKMTFFNFKKGLALIDIDTLNIFIANKILQKIIPTLNSRSLLMSEVFELCSECDRKEIIDTIRLVISNQYFKFERILNGHK